MSVSGGHSQSGREITMRPASMLLCLFLSVSVLAGYAVSDDDIKADDYFQRGERYDSEQNFPEALKWYLKAAELGHAGAQSAVGAFYFKGLGVEQNETEALKWARMSAEQGFATAQAGLGYMYHTGRGAPQNHAEAEKWYSLAAKQGFHGAMIQLARLHDDGGQYVEAIAWAWVALTLARNYDDEQSARDLRNSIVGRDAVTKQTVDRAEALANSLLQTVQ